MIGPNGSDGAILPPLPMGEGKLAENIAHFARVLRRAGLKTSPQSTIDAVAAVQAIGLGSRQEFKAVLAAVFVKRREDIPVFEEAFGIFWRRRDLVEKMIQMMSPKIADHREKEKQKPAAARVSDALTANRQRPVKQEVREEIETDARFTASFSEVLRKMDFAQMNAAELKQARQVISGLVMPLQTVATRRFQPSRQPRRIDARATLRHAMRSGGDLLLPKFKTVRRHEPPLVVLADISGSMSQYTRIFLHFCHALMERRRRMHVFLFGTRLTNVTRSLKHRDPDEALAACTTSVSDWSGGTRIGPALARFNKDWSRRVMSGGAVVLLITDGLERDDVGELSRQVDRLHRSARRLIWLNPLLRFDGFEAKAKGVRAMLPHVDEFRAAHNISSISELAEALNGQGFDRDHDPRRFLERNHQHVSRIS